MVFERLLLRGMRHLPNFHRLVGCTGILLFGDFRAVMEDDPWQKWTLYVCAGPLAGKKELTAKTFLPPKVPDARCRRASSPCGRITRPSWTDAAVKCVLLVARLGQHLPPSRQGLLQQAMPPVIEQVEQHVLHRTSTPRRPDLPARRQHVPAQQPRQVGTTFRVDGHQLAVHKRSCRQAAKNLQLRIAVVVVGMLAAPQPPAGRFHRGQRANPIPLYFVISATGREDLTNLAYEALMLARKAASIRKGESVASRAQGRERAFSGHFRRPTEAKWKDAPLGHPPPRAPEA